MGAEVELPPGWWVRNSTGSYSGPPPLEELQADGSGDAGSDDEDESNPEIGLDIRPDSPGWEDIEPDTESLEVKCLLCPEKYPSATAMLDHCTTTHGFDFLGTVKQHDLDFYHTIRYINLIRLKVQEGASNPEAILARTILASDELLRPTMENDALLFTLDEVLNFEDEQDANGEDAMVVDGNHAG